MSGYGSRAAICVSGLFITFHPDVLLVRTTLLMIRREKEGTTSISILWIVAFAGFAGNNMEAVPLLLG
jgi:hypothetical protein